MSVPIQTVLVPQGAEYRAVYRGLRHLAAAPIVLPIPVGPIPLTQHLKTLQKAGYFSNQSTVLVTGLCGSLKAQHRVGGVVIYRDCVSSNLSTLACPTLVCNDALTTLLQQKLAPTTLVRALTSDRVIWSAAEKRSLSNKADVVDMEGYAALEFFNQIGASVAMLRVVSDNCQHDLPDLTAAFSADGALQPLPLAVGMLKQPIAATRLIRGSLQGLKALQTAIASLFAG